MTIGILLFLNDLVLSTLPAATAGLRTSECVFDACLMHVLASICESWRSADASPPIALGEDLLNLTCSGDSKAKFIVSRAALSKPSASPQQAGKAEKPKSRHWTPARLGQHHERVRSTTRTAPLTRFQDEMAMRI